MPPGRNDPCSCGSGRKYKHCCGKSRAESAGPGPSPDLPPKVLERARESATWETDLVAMPASIRGKERFRTVAALVVAGDIVVGTDMLNLDSAEPEEVATTLEAALGEAAERLGLWPGTVMVRRNEVADILRPRLRPRGCAVMVAPVLEYLDSIAADLSFHLSGADTWPAVTPPETWAAWGLPEAMVASLFEAYAAFYRAAPWDWLDVYPPVIAEWNDGAEPWTVSVLGAGMGEYGLAVYSEGEDLTALLDSAAVHPGEDEVYEDDEDLFDGEEFFEDEGFSEHEDGGFDPDEGWRNNPFRNLRGWVVHLGYLHRKALPRATVKEISGARWKVEDLSAYPYISPVLTPGGGLQRELAERLTELLHGVVAFAREHGSRLRAPEGGVFSWTGGRLTLRYLKPPVEAPETGPLPPGFEDVAAKIREGAFSSREELRAELDRRMEEVNAAPQEELGGISPDQALALMNGGFGEGGPLNLSESLDPSDLEHSAFLANARTFLTAMAEMDGIPATTAGNLKRTFVREMVEQMRFEEGFLDRVFRVNKVLNEEDVWPLHVLRVNLEVGGLLKYRKGRFSVTRKGRKLAKPDQMGRLFAHLFRTYFGEFNIAYGFRGVDGPTIQPAVPLLLWQLGVRAREWISLRELAIRILPPRPGMPPPEGSPQFWPEESNLHGQVLEPLEDFGLLEKRDMGRRGTWHSQPEEIQVRNTPLYGRFLRFEW